MKIALKINRQNSILKKIFIIAILLIAIPSFPEIRKKINRDGTIEYYNVKKYKKYKKSKTWKKTNFKSRYNTLIERISGKYGIDPYLIKCIIQVESNFKANAVSVAGAMGLMQIMQHIARYYKVTDPLDPEENLNAGITHFKSLMNYFKNDVSLALAAYHAGLGRVRKRMKIPPIRSTINYVKKVMYYYRGKTKGKYKEKVRKLYRRIRRDGTIEIYN